MEGCKNVQVKICIWYCTIVYWYCTLVFWYCTTVYWYIEECA